jgi:hypothetical protein
MLWSRREIRASSQRLETMTAVSIVAPVYNERADTLKQLVDGIRAALAPITQQFEMPPRGKLWVVLGPSDASVVLPTLRLMRRRSCVDITLRLTFAFSVVAVSMWATRLRCPHAQSLSVYRLSLSRSRKR